MAKAKPFDAADYLDTPELVADYLTEALATGDYQYFLQAIGTAARSKGMKQVSSTTGLSREHLYKAFDVGGNPAFSTVMKVLNTIGIHLEARPN
jgi:probable addiction module antidote protein